MTGHQYSGIKPFEIGNCVLDLVRFTRGEMKSTDNGMDRYRSTSELYGVFSGVDYASVATPSENNKSFS